MFVKAIERGDVNNQYDPDHLVSLFLGILYSLFVQVNRLKDQKEVDELVHVYLDMLCIYNHNQN